MATPLIARVTSNYMIQEDDMLLLTPPVGDPRTPAEYTYDMEQSGHLYVVASTPATPQIGPLDALRDQIAASTDYTTRLALVHQLSGLIAARNAALEAERGNVLLGFIDGCEVRASYMEDDPDEGNGELGAAKVIWSGMDICTDGRSYLNLPTSGGMCGDMELSEWVAIKALARTDIPERLIALAQRYPTYSSVLASPPTTPASSAIRIVRMVSDDQYSLDFGQEFGTDYVCGESLIHFPDDGSGPTLITFDTDDVVSARDLDDLTTLLTSPEVQAARAQALRRGETTAQRAAA